MKIRPVVVLAFIAITFLTGIRIESKESDSVNLQGFKILMLQFKSGKVSELKERFKKLVKESDHLNYKVSSNAIEPYQIKVVYYWDKNEAAHVKSMVDAVSSDLVRYKVVTRSQHIAEYNAQAAQKGLPPFKESEPFRVELPTQGKGCSDTVNSTSE